MEHDISVVVILIKSVYEPFPKELLKPRLCSYITDVKTDLRQCIPQTNNSCEVKMSRSVGPVILVGKFSLRGSPRRIVGKRYILENVQV